MAVKAMLCAELWPHQIPDPALGTPGLEQEGEDSQSQEGTRFRQELLSRPALGTLYTWEQRKDA